MTVTLQKTVYNAFGLKVQSEIELPELKRLEEVSGNTEVEIILGDLEQKWEDLSVHGHFYVEPNTVFFKISDTGIFLIEEGKRVIVSPFKGSDIDKIRLYILGTCMGVILMQRRVLPLHGSAVSINGEAYAIVGDSGAGKSTLTSAFIREGYPFISDDVIAVSLSEEGVPYVMPSYPQQKLWQQTLDKLGMNPKEYKPLFEREDKFAVPVKTEFSLASVPLAGIFELTKTEKSEITLTRVNKLEQLYKMFNHTYRQFLIPKQELTDWHFQITSSICSKIKFYCLERPESTFTVEQLMDLILSTISTEVKK